MIAVTGDHREKHALGVAEPRRRHGHRIDLNAALAFAGAFGIEWHSIVPGRPMRNGVTGRPHSSLGDETPAARAAG